MTKDSVAAQLLESDFGVVNGPKCPRRLSHATRAFAARAMAGEFGTQLVDASFRFDENTHPGTSAMEQITMAVQAIARTAPVPLLDDGELIVGAATMREATNHKVPGTRPLSGISHTTLGFDRALREGYGGIRERIQERLECGDLDADGRELLQHMLACIDAATTWHDRYLQAVRARVAEADGPRRQHWQEVLDSLLPVPEAPPKTFRQAVQALWMLWSFQRLCGNWSGLGRVDAMLGPYLERDLEAGIISLDEARELIAHFWIKGCEWTGSANFHVGAGGDAQFYQNVVLAGMDGDGHDVTNPVTYLVLDVVEELHISDYPIAVRINGNTPERLLRKIARIQQRGGGIVAIYNEPAILKALERFGYEPREARRFANDGCWEIIVPGRTAFGYRPFDTLRLLQNALGLGPEEECEVEFETFQDLYAAFRVRLRRHIASDFDATRGARSGGNYSALVSMLVDDCIERARGYTNRGPVYNVVAPHAGGIPDTANSLFALSKLVYEERLATLGELLDAVRGDWQGHEELQALVKQRMAFYGNDSEAVDAMAVRVFDDFTDLVAELDDDCGVLRPPGISTFGRELQYREHRTATVFGRRKGDILATNLASTPGTDVKGPTAVIRSFCRMDFEKLPNGAPLELKLLPSSFAGREGEDMIVSLMRTFVGLGGLYLHIDVVDSDVLREAQKRPDAYPNLVVRISGWSARFSTLGKEWQDMIIERTQQRT